MFRVCPKLLLYDRVFGSLLLKQRRKAWPSRSRTIKSHNFKGGIDVTAESPESGEIAVVRAWPRPSGRLGVGLTEVPWAQTWALSSELEFALLAIFFCSAENLCCSNTGMDLYNLNHLWAGGLRFSEGRDLCGDPG